MDSRRVVHCDRNLLHPSCPKIFATNPEAHLNLLLNDIRNVATGNIATSDTDPAVIAAADRYSTLLQISAAAKFVLVLCLRHFRYHLRVEIYTLRLPRAELGRACRHGLSGHCLDHRHPYNNRHRPLALIRILSVLRKSIALPVLVWPEMEPANRIARRPSRLRRFVWSDSDFRRDSAHQFYRHVRCRSHRADVCRLSWPNTRTPRFRGIAKPLLEILAGIPTVVYGFFAAYGGHRSFAIFGNRLDYRSRRKVHWPPVLVMGIMIIPFISSLSDDVINAVPQSHPRRVLWPWCHTVRNHTARNFTGSLAGYRRQRPAGRIARHRRDHDRGHGAASLQTDRQSAGGRNNGYGSDCDAVGRRSGI